MQQHDFQVASDSESFRLPSCGPILNASGAWGTEILAPGGIRWNAHLPVEHSRIAQIKTLSNDDRGGAWRRKPQTLLPSVLRPATRLGQAPIQRSPPLVSSSPYRNPDCASITDTTEERLLTLPERDGERVALRAALYQNRGKDQGKASMLRNSAYRYVPNTYVANRDSTSS